MAANLNGGASESCIGKGTKISGKLNFREPARIEGEAEGEITGDEIVISFAGPRGGTRAIETLTIDNARLLHAFLGESLDRLRTPTP